MAEIPEIDLKPLIGRVLSACTDELLEGCKLDRQRHEATVTRMMPWATILYSSALPMLVGAMWLMHRNFTGEAVALGICGCAAFLCAEKLDRKIRDSLCELAAVRGRITGARMLLQRFGFDAERKP